MQELIHHTLHQLSKKRWVYHSEDDFKLALAIEFIKIKSNFEIRLEKPVNIIETFKDYGGGRRVDEKKRIYLDMYILTQDFGKVGIELKYKTSEQTIIDDETYEEFELRDHSAHDVSRYNFREDISRLEKLKASNTIDLGVAILLTNEPKFWKDGFNDKYMDNKFRLGSDFVPSKAEWDLQSEYFSKNYIQDPDGYWIYRKTGKRTWIHSPKFTKDLTLSKDYPIQWKEYRSQKGLDFRYLAIII